MTQARSFLSILCLFVGTMLAQTTTSTALTEGGWVTSGTIASASTLMVGSSGTVTFRSPDWWAPAESRKDDGKGPTAKELDSSAKVLQARNLASARYQQIAMSIGLNPSPILDEAHLLDAIHDVGLHVYDFDKVDQYLYRKALRQKANTRWVWKPLREADSALTGLNVSRPDTVGIVFPAQYAHAVPLRVLESAASILEKVPGARFLVSDYEVINPDPFLAVTTEKLLRAGKIFIIERWDEPGYDEESKPLTTVVARR